MTECAIVPAWARTRSRAESRRCVSNLKQIGLGVVLYSQRNGARMPPWGNPIFFESLRNGFLEDRSVYRCPEGTPPEAEALGIEVEDYRTWTGGPGLSSGQIAKFGSRIPIAWDRSASWHDGSRHVLFADGHIEEIPQPAFQELLAGWQKELGLER